MIKTLVTGGAGFIGSHLCEKLLKNDFDVTCVDNFITSEPYKNITQLMDHKNFHFIMADVSQPTDTYMPKKSLFDEIYHLASPASPRGYQDAPIQTFLVNSFGTYYLTKYAHQHGSKILFASTSEVYGDPKEHPQKETYWGNVNPIGVRSCYDESKRYGEMVISVFQKEYQIDSRVVRIFNTYGPRMDPKDGRIIPNFVSQALKNKPITVYGDGTQTRSFCFVDDMVEGIYTLMNLKSAKNQTINIGNPVEITVYEVAKLVKKLTKSKSAITFAKRPEDDPSKRKPDIYKASKILRWKPHISFEVGLIKTIAYFKNIID
jgi:nucleoside-diphosphate-sugar epimerase